MAKHRIGLILDTVAGLHPPRYMFVVCRALRGSEVITEVHKRFEFLRNDSQQLRLRMPISLAPPPSRQLSMSMLMMGLRLRNR